MHVHILLILKYILILSLPSTLKSHLKVKKIINAFICNITMIKTFNKQPLFLFKYSKNLNLGSFFSLWV